MLIITHSFFPRQPGNEKTCRILTRSPSRRNLIQQAARHFVFSHQRKLPDAVLRDQRHHIRRHTEAELGSPSTLILTGGAARFVEPLVYPYIYDPNLLLKGLAFLYERNCAK